MLALETPGAPATAQAPPARVRIAAFDVAGLTVRTSSRHEENPKGARIAPLWRQYRGLEVAPPQVPLFGVYSDYASDAFGLFNLTAGIAQPLGTPGAVRVEAGDYLVFRTDGEMPQARLAAWRRIWQYFAAHPEIRRRYRSDFEAHEGEEALAIHIGIATA